MAATGAGEHGAGAAGAPRAAAHRRRALCGARQRPTTVIDLTNFRVENLGRVCRRRASRIWTNKSSNARVACLRVAFFRTLLDRCQISEKLGKLEGPSIRVARTKSRYRTVDRRLAPRRCSCSAARRRASCRRGCWSRASSTAADSPCCAAALGAMARTRPRCSRSAPTQDASPACADEARSGLSPFSTHTRLRPHFVFGCIFPTSLESSLLLSLSRERGSFREPTSLSLSLSLERLDLCP